MRWAQLTLVENDPGAFDPGFWIGYFERLKAEGVCLSAGGCVAFYPTRVPCHHRSAWLGDGDPFGELVRACKSRGMTVIARIDPHAIHDDAARAHPEWVAVDATGRKRRHWASPEMWVACTLGDYAFGFTGEVIDELMARYPLDGIFANRWEGSGPCWCASCRRSFRKASGLALPAASANPASRARVAYRAWREARQFALWESWDARIRRANPDARYVPNAGGGPHAGLDLRRTGELAPMLVADRQARSGPTPAWMMGRHAKDYRAAAGRKPAVGLFNVGLEEAHRWKDSVNSEAEIRIWTAEAVANGMRPWMCKFAGVLHDRRWLVPVERLFAWHHRAARYLRNTASLARAALVTPQQTARIPGWEARRLDEAFLGMSQALLESRTPFDHVLDRRLDAGDLDRYRVIGLADVAALSAAQCRAIERFAARGGGVVATFETSRRDERGRPRRTFGLERLFGVAPAGPVLGPMRNSYLALAPHPRTGRFHRALAGLEDAGRIINGVHRLPVRARARFPDPPLRLVPPYPDLPMEKVYPRGDPAGPELFLRAFGRGRIAYVPWDLARTAWSVGAADHSRLLANLFAWAAGGEAPPVSVDGPGMLDVTAFRQEGSVAVHLVNLTNARTMRGPLRELGSAGPYEVTIRLPRGTAAAGVRLLKAGRRPAVRRTGRAVTVRVPAVRDHEVVAVDLEGARGEDRSPKRVTMRR